MKKELSRKDIESIYYKVHCYYEVKAKLYEDILNFDTPYMYNYICKDYIHNIRLSAWNNLDILKAQCTTIIQTETHEKHICPLQLEVIQRCIELWTNPNDIVFDPFGGIGSTPYVALKLGRRGIASELKDSYFEQLKKNVESVAAEEPEVFPVGEKSIEDVVA